MYKAIFYACMFCMAGYSASAQMHNKFVTTPIVDNLDGRPVDVNKYAKVKGSPYLYDDWLHGEVVTNDGKAYKKMLIKFNTEKDELIFVYETTDEPQKFADPIKMFTINAEQDRVFENGFPKIDRQSNKSYYELLVQGPTTLLKRHREVLQDGIDDVSRAITDGVYTKFNSYYIFKNNQMQLLKLNKNSILKLLADKSADVTAYADSQKIDFEQEEDVKKLINYYNTLK